MLRMRLNDRHSLLPVSQRRSRRKDLPDCKHKLRSDVSKVRGLGPASFSFNIFLRCNYYESIRDTSTFYWNSSCCYLE